MSIKGLISIFNYTGASVTLCPCGWVSMNSSCYYFSTEKANWDDARSYCLSHGGDLVLPRNKEEDVAILKIINQRKLDHPWMGLVRRYDKKILTVDGLKPKYSNWILGEPNYFNNEENCGHYWGRSYGIDGWNDVACWWKLNFICELKRSKRELKSISIANSLSRDHWTNIFQIYLFYVDQLILNNQTKYKTSY